VVQIDTLLHLLALAPVGSGTAWMGAVGGSTTFAAGEAATLAGLTRSEVVILDATGGVTAATVDRATALELAEHAAASRDGVHSRTLSGGDVLVTASLVDEGEVLFLREVERELAMVPPLRRTALVTTAAVLAFALMVGALFARRLAAPVSELADAAEDFGAGRPEMPLRSSSIVEVRRLAGSFRTMRETLARRLTELEEANRALEAANQELEERQDRLASLQAELVQRERLASSGRLLAQLAHEIRNPVASVRNCMEVVRRRGNLEGEAAEFADMAVDELLRMHELAERMLDLHRPRQRGVAECDAAMVARETVQLVQAGAAARRNVSFSGGTEVPAAIHPDDLRQILLNLVLNAIEAAPEGAPVEIVASQADGRVCLEVLDRGPGLAPGVGEHIFDPFFTTKDELHGVGLGLYTAEGLVRSAGGTLAGMNREPGPGARFVVELPVAEAAVGSAGDRTS
jgi:signal transduction histidine kinase